MTMAASYGDFPEEIQSAMDNLVACADMYNRGVSGEHAPQEVQLTSLACIARAEMVQAQMLIELWRLIDRRESDHTVREVGA